MKWSFKEDYIVCKFYLEHVQDWRDHLDEVMTALKAAGFGARKIGSVKMRIQNLEHLHIGTGLSNVAKQTQNIYQAMIGSRSRKESLTAYIRDNYVEMSDEDYEQYAAANGLQFLVKVDPLAPTFNKILFGFIAAHNMKDSDVYNSIYMSRSTFGDIKKDESNPSREKVMMLCFGIKLTYEESVQLMAAAGYVFRKNKMLDVIVESYLKNQNFDIEELDCDLYDLAKKTLFAVR